MSNVLVVVTHNAGMSVAEVTNLRRQMRQAGAGFKVTKNRLARLALEAKRAESGQDPAAAAEEAEEAPAAAEDAHVGSEEEAADDSAAAAEETTESEDQPTEA
jgi:large subunit ribosomal protein L10